MDPMLDRPLKDKLKEHYENRNFKLTPEKASRAGVTFFWVFTLFSMFSTYNITAPYVFSEDQNALWWAKAFLWFLFIETTWNWWLCLRIGRSILNQDKIDKVKKELAEKNNSMDTTKLPIGWKYCAICQLDTPPRSHHCRLCGHCILKRDHHCFFTGYCIGFSNLRRFYALCFYMMLASGFGLYLCAIYMNSIMPIFSYQGFKYIPFVSLGGLVYGSTSLMHFLLILELIGFVVIAVSSAGFFLWTTLLICRGQTTHEISKNITIFRESVFEHLLSCFGPGLFLNFIIPLPMRQKGDGMTWEIKSLKAH